MKLILISIILCALLVASLPQDTERHFGEKCANNQLSCCSNLKSTAEANGGITNSIQALGSTVDLVSNIIPISILSGCAPIIGNAQTTCINYLACCVPRDDRDGHYNRGNTRDDDENKCQVLRDTKVTRNPGLLDLPERHQQSGEQLEGKGPKTWRNWLRGGV